MNLIRQDKSNVTIAPGTWFAVTVAGAPRAVFADYMDAQVWFSQKYPANPVHEIVAVTIT